MHNSQAVRKVLYWLLLCLYYQVYIILCSYNISLTHNTTNQRLSFIQHFIQRLSFSLLIILYCLFIVPECSIALFTLHVHVVGSCRYCWSPAACLLFACLLPLGTSICSLHIIVRPAMSHFLHHLVLGECCLLHPLLTSSWCLVALFDLLLCRRSHLLRAASCVYWYLDSLLPT